MIFHENPLQAEDSHEISYPIFFQKFEDVTKFVVCCSCDRRFREHNGVILPHTFQRIAAIMPLHFLKHSFNPNSTTYNLQQTTISNFASFSKITIRHDIS